MNCIVYVAPNVRRLLVGEILWRNDRLEVSKGGGEESLKTYITGSMLRACGRCETLPVLNFWLLLESS